MIQSNQFDSKKELSLVIPLLKAISAEKIKLEHKALKKERLRTDMYFFEYKFAVEIDEKEHTDRNKNEENEIQSKIGKHSDCTFFYRINPDAEGFDMFLKLVKYRVTFLNQIKKH